MTLEELLTINLRAIVPYPDEVNVTAIVRGRYLSLYAGVAREDMPRMIGKNGKTIQALRVLAKAANDTKIRVSIKTRRRGQRITRRHGRRRKRKEKRIKCLRRCDWRNQSRLIPVNTLM